MDTGHDERGSKARIRSSLTPTDIPMDGRNLTYFISDLHLGAGYIADKREHERTVCRFLQHIAPTARRLYLLGDVLDYWFEYRTVVPRGYVRFFGELARLADSGVEIVWFTGNHDIWLFDYIRDEIGVEIVDPAGGGVLRTIDGTLFYLGHGDGMGRQPAGFRFMRSMFRNRFCQKLYSAVHPRWTIPFAHAWSSHSRKGSAGSDTLDGRTRTDLEVFARRKASENPDLKYIVLGHHHVLLDEPVGPGCRMIILGDWINRFSYAVFDGHELKLNEFSH